MYLKPLQLPLPCDLVNNRLIPALDVVGSGYEGGTLFLPQLLSAAQAAQAVFEVLKDALARTGGGMEARGTLAVATVKGDIHDIGENIVKTVLESRPWLRARSPSRSEAGPRPSDPSRGHRPDRSYTAP